MPRFFIDGSAISGGTATVTGSDARHIALSLRMRVGDSITLCDFARNEYRCSLESITPTEVSARVISVSMSEAEPPYTARLYQALPKGERADVIVQKSVECGVSEIVFFESERCIAKMKGDSVDKKLARFGSIALEAAKQCGRGIVPEVRFVGGISDALAEMSDGELRFMCYEGGSDGEYPTEKLGELLARFENGRENYIPSDIRFMVGPEGGFGYGEVKLASESGLLLAGLGSRILRCETAPPFVLTCLAARYELGSR